MKTHTGWKNETKESGHAFISEACFPLTLSAIAHSLLPQCYSPDVITLEVLKLASLHCESP